MTAEQTPDKHKRERKPKAPVALAIPAPTKKPWELTEAEVELVRNHIAKGASNSELAFCLGVARRFKLDPFRGQIWFVKRRDKSLDRYDKEKKEKVTGYRWIPIVGINGLLHIAARDHKKSFGSIKKPEYGPLIEVEWREGEWRDKKWVLTGTHKLMVPEWATVEVYKRNDPIATVGEVYWKEIYPNIDSAPMVRQMPRLMLGKCAKAQGIRSAYPATDGLYIQEEFMVEQWEPGDNGKRSLELVAGVDAKIAQFKELAQRMPTEDECSRLESGASSEEILLEKSLAGQAANSKPKEIPPEETRGSVPVQSSLNDIWPKGSVPSTAREPGMEG